MFSHCGNMCSRFSEAEQETFSVKLVPVPVQEFTQIKAGNSGGLMMTHSLIITSG